MTGELETLAAESLGDDRTLLAGASGSTPASAEAPPSPGSVVGRYVLIAEVGRGAMGVVYSAYDPKLDRKVAVKLLIDSSSERQSLREAQALARLNHPNVVKVYDAGEHDSRVFMAMEFVVGEPLGDWRERTKPSLASLLDVFRRAALGLAAAHEAGLVHRDFKPDNVMIAEDGRVLVMDFGLAVTRQADPDASISAGKLWASGTPAYMSPEQFKNDDVGPKSDQFSFFVALYEALCGERPFRGDSFAALADAVSSGRSQHSSPLRSSPAWLRRVVLRGLSVTPDERHASMQAVAEQLAAGLNRRGRAVRFGLLGAGALAALVVSLLPAAKEDPELTACRVDAQALASSWAPQWRERSEPEFLTKLDDDGPAIWARVSEDVDAYARTWASVHDEACTARFVTEAITPDELDARVRCLADQREYLGSLFDALASVDAEGMREIAAVTAELPRPASCVDDRRATRDFDRASQELVAAARRELMRARGRIDAGDNAGGRALAEAALATLTDVDAPVTRAELLRELADVAYDEGELELGEQSMIRALHEAGRSGDAKLLAECWVGRVTYLVTVTKDSARSEHLLEAVEVAVEAVPDEHELHADLDSLRGLLALQAGRTTAARDAFASALERAERHDLGPRAIARYAKWLGAAQAQLGEVAEARRSFTRALELSVSLFGERHVSVIGDYGNLGLLCRTEGDDQCAREHFDEAIARTGPTQPARARYLVLLGQLEYDQGNTDAAKRLADDAIAIYEAAYGPLHPDLTAARLLRSLVYKREGDMEGAYEQAQKLLAIAEATTPPEHPKRAIAHANFGEALRVRGELEAALAEHELALRIREAALDPGDPRIGYSLAQKAQLLLELGRPAEASGLAQAAIVIFDGAPGNESWRADARFTLAQCLDDPDAARAALTIYESLGPGHADAIAAVRGWLDHQ